MKEVRGQNALEDERDSSKAPRAEVLYSRCPKCLGDKNWKVVVVEPRFEMALDLPLRGYTPGTSCWGEAIDLYCRSGGGWRIDFG